MLQLKLKKQTRQHQNWRKATLPDLFRECLQGRGKLLKLFLGAGGNPNVHITQHTWQQHEWNVAVD